MTAEAEATVPAFPTPFSRRRDALRKLPLIRMAQEQLDGIANASYGSVATLTWETASDWDGAVSQDPNVVHEGYGDLEGAGVVQLGYPSTDPAGSDLAMLLPFDEASGSTTASNEAGSPNFDAQGGPSLGNTGAFNTTATNLDGTDDYWQAATAGEVFGVAGQITLFAWVNFDTLGTGNSQRVISFQGQNSGTQTVITLRTNGNSNLEVLARDNANDTLVQATGSTTLSTGTWYAFGGVIDAANDQAFAYLDGSQDGSGSGTLSGSASAWSASSDYWSVGVIQKADGSNEFVDGTVEVPQVFTRAASGTQVGNMSSLSGSLTTGSKTFSSSVTPDLTALDYTLNGQSIDLDVIGSPGTASEEIVTQTLDGSTGYTLTWSNSHQEFRIRPNFSTTTVTSSPVVRSVTLTT